MADYRSYTHVLRLDKEDCTGILDGPVVVQPKLDGTSALVYSDGERVLCGSRKRELTVEDDNAGFCDYILNSDDSEVAALREYVLAHPNYIIYGEFLGGVNGRKLTGSIKRYLEGGFYVFDVFDVERGDYLTYDEYYPEISAFYGRTIPAIAKLDHPTKDEVLALLDKTDYDLAEGTFGEGIVIKRQPTYRDNYGNCVIAKVVRDEYKQEKSKPKKVFEPSEFEREFVDTYCTDAFLDKCRNKVRLALDVDEFDADNKKHTGYFFSLINSDLVDEEVAGYIRKKKYKCVIDFGRVRSLVMQKGRDFLGL